MSRVTRGLGRTGSTPGKSVAPYTPGTKKSFDGGSTVSSKRIVEKAEFDGMLELPSVKAGTTPMLAKSFYDLSISLRSLNDVLDQIRYFKMMAPLRRYRYRSVIELLHAAAMCPADVQYVLLTIAAKMVKLDIVASRSDLRELVKICEALIRGRHTYKSFGKNQAKPRSRLEEMLKLFRAKINERVVKTERRETFDTKEIEMFVEEQKRREKSGEKLMTEEDADEFLRQGPRKDRADDATEVFIEESGSLIEDAGDDEKNLTLPGTGDRGSGIRSSIQRFLASADDLFDRIDRGSGLFKKLAKDKSSRIRELAKLFVKWDQAYEGCQKIWEIMKDDDDFEVDVLISQIPVSFADFLIEALHTFAASDGIQINPIEPPE